MRGLSMGLVALAAGSLAGCTGGPEGTSVVLRPIEADAAGVLLADAWPDACELGTSGSDDATGVQPEDGSLPDGTALPVARGCTWQEGDVGLSLEVLIVTTDVLEAWAGYQYMRPLRRPVSEIGDEAFLTPVLVDDEEELWVCRGLTIFVVRAPGLPQDQARTEMFDVAMAAAAALEDTRAGSTPVAEPSAPAG